MVAIFARALLSQWKYEIHTRCLSTLFSMNDPDGLIATLNAPSSPSKLRLATLAKLADRALTDPDGVLSAFHSIDEHFELLLNEKHEANKQYGTGLGRMHETVLLILLRCTRYTLTTAQLLDFLRGDLPLAMAVLQQLIGCAAYEEDAICCALKLLCGFMRADTYAEFALRESGSASFDVEGSVEAFGEQLERFSVELLRSKLLLVAVPALASRLAASARTMGMAAELSPMQEGSCRAFMALVCNLSLLHFDSADASRSALATASSAGSVLLLPLLQRLVACASASAASASPPPPPPPLLSLALRAAILLCFRAPAQVAAAVRTSAVLAALAPPAARPAEAATAVSSSRCP